MARIGIYGGSFNPPHLGHIFAARKARQLLGLDKILLIPAAIPPHKAVAEGSPDGETRFALTQPLVCRTGGNRVLSSYVTAHDSIDGDLSGRVKIALTDGSSLAISGTHTAELRVTNSLGDTAAVPVTVEVSAADTNPAGITLTEYLIYLPAGGSYAPMDYVAGVGGSDSKNGVTASSTVNMNVPGAYEVVFTYRSGSTESHTRQIVVVE